MEGYWNKRFSSQGRVWGSEPSLTAAQAERIFRTHNVKNILIPGSGYGRHADFFAAAGYRVTGIEISSQAIALAKPNPAVRYKHGSVLGSAHYTEKYDAVYCFNVLHLFRREQRKQFINLLWNTMQQGGLAFLTVFSEHEPQYGRGRQVEKNTFESKPGRPVHFFTEADIRAAMARFTILETGLIDDPENHGEEGAHTHRLRFICARKQGAHDFDGERYRAAARHQREWGRQLIQDLRLRGDERILDLGCGDGLLTAELAHVVPRGSVLGIDASAGMITTARRQSLPNLEFRAASIEEMAFTSEFDLLYSNATLHWVKDHRILLVNCARALKPGGRLRFNFAGAGNCAAFIRVLKHLMTSKTFIQYFNGFDWPWYMPDGREYTMLAENIPGLRDIRVWEENADRTLTADEMTRWIDQPSLVPFLPVLPPEIKTVFRDTVVREMLGACKQGQDRYFESFRRINIEARKETEWT